MPPESIAGYITLGRGVSIHRDDCGNFKRLAVANPERVIPVEWGTGGDRSFPVDINVRAYDRRGLLRDVSAVLADSKINIHAMNTLTHENEGIADMNLKITVHDLEELSRVLARIQGLPNILAPAEKSDSRFDSHEADLHCPARRNDGESGRQSPPPHAPQSAFVAERSRAAIYRCVPARIPTCARIGT